MTTPGLHPKRLSRLIDSAIDRCDLRLHGLTVVTEAATGPYVVTPVLAAAAGADVFAVTRPTRYGSVDYVRSLTVELANLCGCSNRLCVVEHLTAESIGSADIMTNSGHVRPIDASTIALMKSTAVIPLMYESWEFRASDLDLDACVRAGISVAGTNECHPAIDVFSFLGVMATKLLLDAGVAVYGASVLVLCDNPFAPFLVRGLSHAGANVQCSDNLTTNARDLDAILVAMTPGPSHAISGAEAAAISRDFPGTVVADFWGGIDRSALAATQVPFWPQEDVPPGHMGILPSAVGPEPVVRLQCGGLKVGEVMARAAARGTDPVEAAVQSGFGQAFSLVTA